MADMIERNSFAGEEGAWEMFRAHPHAALRPDVIDYVGYRESASQAIWRREVPSAVIPVIINFSAAFRIRHGGSTDRDYASFTAGLFSRPVIVGSTGAACCVQINLTPLGALRLFHLPQSELANRTVSLDEILAAEGRSLADELQDAEDWSARFALLDCFIARRFAAARETSATVNEAWAGLTYHHGRASIVEIARSIGVSRRHLAKLCRSELGMTPKSLARILRFDHTRRLASTVPRLDWAELAYEAGYADQAHLVREFHALSGLTPSELLRRDRVETGLIEPSLH
jgi:AraC-like DNA-binding protein